MVLQERFELVTDMNLNQVPLPIGLLEQYLVGVAGFEPADPSVPNRVLYQTELHTVKLVGDTGLEPVTSR